MGSTRNIIMLNKMYIGTYLSSEDTNNIGHEIINLLKSDNGENYIYAMPYGDVAKEHYGKVKTVLLVRSYGSKLLEILAKATVVEDVIHQCQNNESQKKYIKDNKITYGGHLLDEIFEANKNVGAENAKYITYKCSDVIKIKQDKRVFITTSPELEDNDNNNDNNSDNNNNIVFLLKGINFSSQSPKQYFASDGNIGKIGEKLSKIQCYEYLKRKKVNKDEEIDALWKKREPERPNKQPRTAKSIFKNYENDGNEYKKDKTIVEEHIAAYEKLNEILNNTDLWEKTSSTEKFVPDNKKDESNSTSQTFINLIRKEDDEVIFSNILWQLFAENKAIFGEFARNKLGIKDFKDNFILEKRELHNIDLLIHDDKNLIVIENKIKSGINGLIFDKNDRNKLWSRTSSGEFEFKEINDKKSKWVSQLSKYYNIVNGIDEKTPKSKDDEMPKDDNSETEDENKNLKNQWNGYDNKRFYLLVANYNNLNKSYLEKYWRGKEYTIVRYSKLYEYYKKKEFKIFGTNFYNKDILKALEKHTKNKDNSYEEEMYRRFAETINSIPRKGDK